MNKRLSEIHPIIYHTRIWQKRVFRRIADLSLGGRFASELQTEDLPYHLQETPIAAPAASRKFRSAVAGKQGRKSQHRLSDDRRHPDQTRPDILVLAAGWRGRRAEKGYFEGMQLSRGEVVRGVGGGLCQLANLLYWMALHTPLEIVETPSSQLRPVSGRESCLAVRQRCRCFLQLHRLRFHNPTDLTFQIRLWLSPTNI